MATLQECWDAVHAARDTFITDVVIPGMYNYVVTEENPWYGQILQTTPVPVNNLILAVQTVEPTNLTDSPTDQAADGLEVLNVSEPLPVGFDLPFSFSINTAKAPAGKGFYLYYTFTYEGDEYYGTETYYDPDTEPEVQSSLSLFRAFILARVTIVEGEVTP